MQEKNEYGNGKQKKKSSLNTCFEQWQVCPEYYQEYKFLQA